MCATNDGGKTPSINLPRTDRLNELSQEAQDAALAIQAGRGTPDDCRTLGEDLRRVGMTLRELSFFSADEIIAHQHAIDDVE